MTKKILIALMAVSFVLGASAYAGSHVTEKDLKEITTKSEEAAKKEVGSVNKDVASDIASDMTKKAESEAKDTADLSPSNVVSDVGEDI